MSEDSHHSEAEVKMHLTGHITRNQLIKLGLGALLLLALVSWIGEKSTHAQSPPGNMATQYVTNLVRVGISDDAMETWEVPSVSISAPGVFRVFEKAENKPVLTVGPNTVIKINKTPDGFAISQNEKTLLVPSLSGLLIKPDTIGTMLSVPNLTRRGKVPSYRGYFEIVPASSSPLKLVLVNVLPLQDYLRAVVPNELPAHYGFEAVKAQAIAARNYTIRPRERSWSQYDICDSQYCQAYYGAQTEDPVTTKAVEDSQGIVALYQGEPILALYSSSHGGHSESYENAFSDIKTNAFPANPLPYLTGKPDIPMGWDLSIEEAARAFYTRTDLPSFDKETSYYRWKREWTREELEQSIAQQLSKLATSKSAAALITPAFTGDFGMLKDIHVVQRGVSGKAMNIVIETTTGTWSVQKELLIRKVFSKAGKMLPSANIVFTLNRQANGELQTIVVNGGGFGHGVGMSQIGASYMGKHGKNAFQILAHYYSGIQIGTIPLFSLPTQSISISFTPPQTNVLLKASGAPGCDVNVSLNQNQANFVLNSQGQAVFSLDPTQIQRGRNTFYLYPSMQCQQPVKAWLEFPITPE